MKYVVDTNIILLDAEAIFQIADAASDEIIIAETVLDEIDNKKHGFEEINFQARAFSRILTDSKLIKTEKIGAIATSVIHVHYNSQVYTVKLVAKDSYKASTSYSATPSVVNDRMILEIACEFAEDGVFVSNDIAARSRAISIGLKAIAYTPVDVNDCEFTVTVNAPELEYKTGTYNYITVEETGQYKLKLGCKGSFYDVDETELMKQYVKPINNEQKLFSAAISSGLYDVLVCESPAGGGKTLVALSAAMTLVKDRTLGFTKIIYIRNSIESVDKGEDLGYLKGSLEDKTEIYNFPLFDSLEFIARKELKKTRTNPKQEEIDDKVSELVSKYKIDTMWVGALRGRTISNSVVILDEVQNMSIKTLKLVLSRLDDGCRVIILGNIGQQDNWYLNKYNNALALLKSEATKGSKIISIYAVELSKIVRGPITEFTESLGL